MAKLLIEIMNGRMNLGLLNELPKELFFDFKQIDSGSFSDIFVATHLKTKTKVALKISLKHNDIEYLQREANIHKSLHHPFICQYFADFETENLFLIAMELVEGTNLLELVNKYKGLHINEVKSIFSQLIIVMEYMHEINISHRDLKLENIMIDKYGHIRLIDFGFSSLDTIMTTCCGSIPYCAPEILLGNSYTKSADIWSLGIILYTLIQGFLPFYHNNIKMLVNNICSNGVYFPPSFDATARGLIEKMLVKDPKKRISLDEIKKHHFVEQEKLFLIDYKNLFAPTLNEADSKKKTQLPPIPLKANNSMSLTKNIFNLKMRKNCKKGYNIRVRHHSTNEITCQTEAILHGKIISQSDSIDENILCRNDFAFNLNKLIEFAYIKL